VDAPLAVEMGLNEPQTFSGLQLHLTPAFALSLETITDNVTVLPSAMESESGPDDRETEMATGVGAPPQPDKSAPASTARKIHLGFICSSIRQKCSAYRADYGAACPARQCTGAHLSLTSQAIDCMWLLKANRHVGTVVNSPGGC
jgi:hypothetical protein